MSNNNQKIKHYISNNDFSKLSISELSEKIKVSSSAITRFAFSEGFNGYKELKISYNNKKDSINTNADNLAFSMQRTFEIIPDSKLDFVANQIVKHNKVIFLGESFTYLNAQYIERMLRKINIKASSLNVASDLELISPEENTVFIFLSNSGMNSNVKRAAKKIHTNKKIGQLIISITSNTYSNIKDLSNEWISGYFTQENETTKYELPTIANMILSEITAMLFHKIYNINKNENDKLIESISYEKEK